MKHYILDACALIAYIEDEKGAEVIEHLLRNCKKGKNTVYLHRINYFEVYLNTLQTTGQNEADSLQRLFTDLNVQVVYDLSDTIIQEATLLKTTFKMSLADSILLGFAKIAKLEIVTSDHHEFDIVESKTRLKFKWIR